MFDHLPTKDAAERVGISHDALLRRIQRGSVKAIKIGVIWVISQEEINRLLKQREFAS